ncbi:hypothetical protein [Ramlibacter montanisoli]|uniref:hypothetical protein n=1 Tax=Ramlibacter montanisoli TaxID=2732512 RepID=UPI00209C6773|nr:hypothetical protein [Ramlibacter montanisoli]
MKTRRTLLVLALAACAVLPVQAQVGDWPKRQPVKLVAVFPRVARWTRSRASWRRS